MPKLPDGRQVEVVAERFNSLFEMLLLAVGSNLLIDLVSILYLRCRWHQE